MTNIFKAFDERIGVDGYYEIIRNMLFPNSTPHSIDLAAFQLEERLYPKGSLFTRIRRLSNEDAENYLGQKVTKEDFYPPHPHRIVIPQGRFNGVGKRSLYLADHPFVAMAECSVRPGDHLLVAYIRLSTDMHFYYVKPGKDKFSQLISELVKAEDPRFYPVISRVNDDIFSFQGFQGIAYDSVKVMEGQVDNTWGTISTNTNLSISSKHIKDTDFVVGWLSYCNYEGGLEHVSMFKPLSTKKKNKLVRVDIRDSKSIFIRDCKKVMLELKDVEEKTKRLLAMGEHSEFSKSPVRILSK